MTTLPESSPKIKIFYKSTHKKSPMTSQKIVTLLYQHFSPSFLSFNTAAMCTASSNHQLSLVKVVIVGKQNLYKMNTKNNSVF